MDFTFSEDQLAFCDSVRDFLRNEVTPEVVRQSWDSETGRSRALWSKIAEMGLTGMLVPEAFGGLGMNELDFVLLAEECGKVALPEPLVDNVLVAAPLLASLAADDARCAAVLEKMATGEAVVAVGHAVNPFVADAHIADYLLMADGNRIHLVERKDVNLVAEQSVDPSRRIFTVQWTPNDSSVIASGAAGVDLLTATLNRGALGAAAQLLGVATEMVARTVQYTTERSQFGKPIGSYQALKHHMANCAVKIEFARAPLYRAAYTLSRRPVHAGYAVSHAKVACGEAALLSAKNGIQSHGAMGYTWECDLHIWMKRAWVLDKAWGHPGFHKFRFHEWLLKPNAKIGADMTFGEQMA